MRRHGVMILGIAVAAAAIVTILLPPIAQDPAYHNFADRRTILGVPNLLNVISNVPFVLVGVLGLCVAASRRAESSARECAVKATAGVWPPEDSDRPRILRISATPSSPGSEMSLKIACDDARVVDDERAVQSRCHLAQRQVNGDRHDRELGTP